MLFDRNVSQTPIRQRRVPASHFPKKEPAQPTMRFATLVDQIYDQRNRNERADDLSGYLHPPGILSLCENQSEPNTPVVRIRDDSVAPRYRAMKIPVVMTTTAQPAIFAGTEIRRPIVWNRI